MIRLLAPTRNICFCCSFNINVFHAKRKWSGKKNAFHKAIAWFACAIFCVCVFYLFAMSWIERMRNSMFVCMCVYESKRERKKNGPSKYSGWNWRAKISRSLCIQSYTNVIWNCRTSQHDLKDVCSVHTWEQQRKKKRRSTHTYGMELYVLCTFHKAVYVRTIYVCLR